MSISSSEVLPIQLHILSIIQSPSMPLALPSLVAARVGRSTQRLRTLAGATPPSSMILVASLAFQLGTALSKSLFDQVGSTGATFIKTVFGAALLLLIWRSGLSHRSFRDYGLISLLGLAIAGMSLCFYAAIARIPLGIASALEFVGPLSVAIAGSRRWLDMVWVALAVTGVVLLAPLGEAQGIHPVGMLFALLSASCWAIYILVSGQASQSFAGGTGLAIAMTVASIAMAPFGIAEGGISLLEPQVLLIGSGVALLGNVIPYSLEYQALKTLPPRIFGVLISIEPAIAALVGFFVLREALSLRAITAIAMVTVAAMGVTWFGRSPSEG